jgi:sterol desaturase/sphingolipid hydroxylase (fatty acid hydroxylase superfamily)
MRDIFTKVKETLLAPFASWHSLLASLAGVIDALRDFGERSAWPFLLSCLATAWLAYRTGRKRGWIAERTSFKAFAFPREIFRHRSAILDYKFAAIDLTFRGLYYAPLASGLSLVVYRVATLAGGGPAHALASTSPRRDAILLTLVTFVVEDLGNFVAHMLMHRIPLLWHFHEVHHSAEVLTPVTVYRVHPVERMISVVSVAVLGGLSAAAFGFVSHTQVAPVTILGVNGFFFVFSELIASLRHSHIWISYGPFLSRILISPAQHQIHHSVAQQHLEKNYGFTLAIWDWLLGSLYVPRTRETLRFGVPTTDPRDFSSVPRVYVRPFVNVMRHLRGKRGEPPP